MSQGVAELPGPVLLRASSGLCLSSGSGKFHAFSASPWWPLGALSSITACSCRGVRLAGREVTRGIGGQIQLWTALDAAVSPRGDTAARDAAAWFQIKATHPPVRGPAGIRDRQARQPALPGDRRT